MSFMDVMYGPLGQVNNQFQANLGQNAAAMGNQQNFYSDLSNAGAYNQGVTNNLYGGGQNAGFGAQTDYYTKLGAAYGAASTNTPYAGAPSGGYPAGAVEYGGGMPGLSYDPSGSDAGTAGWGSAPMGAYGLSPAEIAYYQQQGGYGGGGIGSDTRYDPAPNFNDRFGGGYGAPDYTPSYQLPSAITAGMNPSGAPPAMSTSFESRWGALPGGGLGWETYTAPQAPSFPSQGMYGLSPAEIAYYQRNGGMDSFAGSAQRVPTPEPRPASAPQFDPYDPSSYQSFDSRYGQPQNGGGTAGDRDALARAYMARYGSPGAYVGGGAGANTWGGDGGSGFVGGGGDTFTGFPYQGGQSGFDYRWNGLGGTNMTGIDTSQRAINAGDDELVRLYNELMGGGGGRTDGLTYGDINIPRQFNPLGDQSPSGGSY